MGIYESIFIIKQDMTDEEVEKIINKMKGVVERSGGEILKTENWKKRKLAYEVRKEKKGIYILFHLKGGGKLVNELERSYKLDDAVIKFITIRLNGNKPLMDVKKAELGEKKEA